MAAMTSMTEQYSSVIFPPKLPLITHQHAVCLEPRNIFAGHKMKHLFSEYKFVETLIAQENGSNSMGSASMEMGTLPFQDEGAKRAFENWNGTVFDHTHIKYHGECSLVIFDSNPFSSIEDIIERAAFYKRHDTKSDTQKREILIQEGVKDAEAGNTPRYLPLAAMETMQDTVTKTQTIRSSEAQDKEVVEKEVTTHCYLWVLRDKPNKETMKKKQYKAAVKMREALGQYIKRMITYGIRKGSRSVELVGKKSQGAVGFVEDYVLIDHDAETLPHYILNPKQVPKECNEGYNAIINTANSKGKILVAVEFMKKCAIEGFVLEDPITATKYKFRADSVMCKTPHDFANKIWRNKKMTVEEKTSYIAEQGMWILLPAFIKI